MPTLYVVQSKSLQKWGWDVGLSKHLYKIGLTNEDAASITGDLSNNQYAGCSDWKLLAHETSDDVEEVELYQRVGRKETVVDPTYYPRIKNASGIFKVKVENVEHALLVEKAMANQELTAVKVTAKTVAAYLLRIALG